MSFVSSKILFENEKFNIVQSDPKIFSPINCNKMLSTLVATFFLSGAFVLWSEFTSGLVTVLYNFRASSLKVFF